MCSHYVNYFVTLIFLACGTLITCVMPEWRKSDLQGQVIEMQISKQGIWWNCMFFSTGNWHCDDYDRVLLGLPAELQTARALMVLACILGFLGYCLSQVGLGCTTFMEDNQASKRKSEHISKMKILILISELNYIIIIFKSASVEQFASEFLLFVQVSLFHTTQLLLFKTFMLLVVWLVSDWVSYLTPAIFGIYQI